MIFFLQFTASLLLVAFGFPFIAAAVGYAFFWVSLTHRFQRIRDRFWVSVLWFGLVQAIQLSWFTSIEYMGPCILIVYALLVFLIGLQFGCLSFFRPAISLSNCLAMAGCWVILEWVRLFFLSGFTWNPVALSLADSSYAISFAAIFGVYGLSFWVIFVNAFGLYALKNKSWRKGVVWASFALLPYFYGALQQEWVQRNISPERTVSVALVQTAILPEEKDYFIEGRKSFIPPLNQWARIWEHLYRAPPVDLIILPETAVSQGANRPIYPIETVKTVWARYFGEESLKDFPPFSGQEKVTNSFIAQAIANHFQADVIIGLDDQKYNAAFFFQPYGTSVTRYEKQILVPVGEYVPFSSFQWISYFLSEQFGIGDSFDVGGEANLFLSSFPIGVSICLEETYSHLMRDLRLKGARLFVTVSNDVWFPKSHLPEQHFQHGRIRAAENGVPVLRSCNTGITGLVDCCGRVVKILPPSEEKGDILYLSMPLRSFQTLYTWWGDSAILSCSVFFLLVGLYTNWYTLRRSFNVTSS